MALEKYNNTIPSELVEASLFKGKVNPFKVMLKPQWLEYKEEFKKIKRELVQHLQANAPQNSTSHTQAPELEKGSLIKLKGFPESIDKTVIKAAIACICPPKYVDYRRGSNECIARFENKAAREIFLNKVKSSPEDFRINNKKVSFVFDIYLTIFQIEIEVVEGEEEENYLKRVKHYQEHLRNKNVKKETRNE